jgi:hypothetical protein
MELSSVCSQVCIKRGWTTRRDDDDWEDADDGNNGGCVIAESALKKCNMEEKIIDFNLYRLYIYLSIAFSNPVHES